MKSAEKWVSYIQIVAALSLGYSYFLPLYLSRSFGTETIRYADGEWGLFFWAIPFSLTLFKISKRWLRVLLCFLSILGGLYSLVLVTFLGTYKHPPLIGFYVARVSIIILLVSWLLLGLMALFDSKKKKEARGN